MKKRTLASAILVLASTFVIAACGNDSKKGESSSGSSKMILSTFGLNEDIVKSDIITPFETANKATLTLDVGNSGDRYTKLESNPNSDIDVIELSQAQSAKGADADLFEKIDESKVPNIANLTDSAKKVYETGIGVPYAVNSIGIIYDKAKVGKEIKEWSDLWDSSLKGKISIPDISSTAGPLTLYAVSDYKGVDITKDSGKAAFEAMKELKPNIVKTYSKSSDLTNMFQSGEIEVAIVLDFAVENVQKVSQDIVYVVPESGTYANYNTINVPKNAKNKELAYKYIDWRISKDLETKTAESLNEAPINKEVELTGDLVNNKTYGDIAERAKMVDFSFVNKNLSGWIDQWNRILNQ